MQRIQTIRLALITVITSALIAAGYELRDLGHEFLGMPKTVVAILTLIFGGGLATVLVNAFLGSRWVRRLIMRSYHVEGHWYLVTSAAPDSPLNPDGILYLKHQPSTGETAVVTTRLDAEGREYTTASDIAFVGPASGHLRYLNYFRLAHPNAGSPFGLSAGRFLCSDDVPFPNRMESDVSLTGEDGVRRQHADRIDDRRIDELRKQYGKHWKSAALRNGWKYVFEDAART